MIRHAFWALALVVLSAAAMTACKPSTAADPAKQAGTAATAIDVKAALAPRTMGDPKASVRIDEYASLSCPHCAAFSKETFDKLKTQYIDTGKVYYTYTDFPLNAPALTAAMVARCLPTDHYFQFVKFLFDTQEKWAFSEKYADYLRENAKLLGMDDAAFAGCTGNEELKSGLVKHMQEAALAHKINSTPAFVFNGLRIVHGALSFDQFQAIIDPLVKK